MNATIHAAEILAARQSHQLAWECETLRRHAERPAHQASVPRRGSRTFAAVRRVAHTTGTLAVFAVFTVIRPIAAALSHPID